MSDFNEALFGAIEKHDFSADSETYALASDSGASEAISGYYTRILKRDADTAGLDAWLAAHDSGTSLEAIKSSLINSAEATSVIDPLVRLYQAAFGRVPDQAGIDNWADLVRGGMTLNQVADGFVGSQEFMARYPTASEADRTAFITDLYVQTLGRQPDAPGLEGWLNSGLSLSQLLIGFSESPEFQARAETNVNTYLGLVGDGGSDPIGSLFDISLNAEAASGTVMDGKVAGATVGIDVNGDGIIDKTEPTVTTDAQGNFAFPEGTETGTIIATGGTDIATGLAFKGKMEAPAGSTVVNPLTTMISKLAALDDDTTKTTAQKLADAQDKLKALLGLDDITSDLTETDFVAESKEGDSAGTDGLSDADATRLYAASVKLLNIVEQGSAAITGADGDVTSTAASDAVFDALAARLNGVGAGETVDLGSSTGVDDDPDNDADDLLINVIKDAAANTLTGDAQDKADAVADSAAAIAAAANKEIDDAVDAFASGGGTDTGDTLVKIVKTQKVVQGEASDKMHDAAGSDDPDGNADALSDSVAAKDGSGFVDETIIEQQNIGDVDGDGTDDDGVTGTDNVDDGGGTGGTATPDTTAPTFTVDSTIAVAEQSTHVIALTANETARFEIVGDNDDFEIDVNNNLVFTASHNYDELNPASNAFSVDVRATDTSGNARDMTISVNVGPMVGAGGYGTIQDAIDVASDGDTIFVSADEYVEQLQVNGIDNLTIRPISDTANVVVKAPDTGLATTGDDGYSSKSDIFGVVTITNATGFEMSGITVDGDNQGSQSSGGNFIGVAFVDSDGTLDGVTVTGVQDATFSGAQRGVAVLATNADKSTGAMNEISVLDSTIEHFQKGGLVFRNSDVTVSGNSIYGEGATTVTAQNAVQISNGSMGTVSNNHVYDIGWLWDGSGTQWSATGLLIYGDTTQVMGNEVYGPSYTSDGTHSLSANGIYIYGDTGGSGAHVISGNTVSGVNWGITSFHSGEGANISDNIFINNDVNLEVYDVEGAINISGSDGVDILTGSPENDIISGAGGSDDLQGSGGNDTLDGGTGSDTAYYAGDSDGFSITRTGVNSYTVSDTNTSDDDEGTDSLVGIETIAFDDKSLFTSGDAQLELRFSQGFESDTSNFFTDTDYGSIARVDTGTNSITSADGSAHAVLDQTDSGPFTRFGGYSSEFDEGFVTTVDIYIDTDWQDGEGFDYSVAATGSDGSHQRDFIFHVAQDETEDGILVAATNNTNFEPRTDLETLNHAKIETSGWYTFEHAFFEAEDGSLAVAMNVFDDSGEWIFQEVSNNPADVIDTVVGGNRYGWFTNIDITGGIEVDNVALYDVI